ncbi:MAG: ABC transporter ATP-binding protein/permease [Peptococcaceae bacterium]|jgi:ATP-binding cassette subfamily B protein|nr:ABC transporter ATP-binding protein/permease [Peptococcaceae bacterium]
MFEEEMARHRSFDLRIWRKLLPFLRPRRALLATIMGLMLLSAGLDVAIPLFQRYAIDRFITPATTEGLGGYLGVYALTVLAQSLIVLLFVKRSLTAEMLLGRDMKRACFVHLQKLSLSYYNTTPVGYMMSRVMSDTNRLSGLIAWGVVDAFWAAAYVSGAFVAMLLLHWRLALVVMTVAPCIALLTWYFQNKILACNRQVRKENSRLTAAYNEGVMGARTAKILVMEENNTAEFTGIAGEMYRYSVRAAILNGLYIPIVSFFSSLAVALVLTRGGYLVMADGLRFGTFAAFITYGVGIFEPIQQLARILADTISAQANIERVAGLLEQKPGIADRPEVTARYGDQFEPKTENWEPIRGDIEFQDVSFQYPDGKECVLEHFNLRIPAGAAIAIVGETGAGKSTLVNLVCRFFEPTGGQILIDGRDYRERSQLWLRGNIGYVLQTPHLFSGTIRENIRYGNLDASDEQVEAAARQVSAHTVAERLEKGYDSDVGEGGDRLSTGEKQLISFARAVLADPRIFVLDEATSSVDTATEKLIQEAIAHILRGRTSFVIAHRLSTVRHAGHILAVRDGKIVEQGRHEELMERKGYYYQLYTRQFAWEATTGALRDSKEPEPALP